MRESKIEEKFRIYARSKGARSFKWVSPGNNGVPDRIVCCPNGRTLYIEFKAPGKKLGPAQVQQKKRLNRMGIAVYVCDGIGQAESILDRALEAPALKPILGCTKFE